MTDKQPQLSKAELQAMADKALATFKGDVRKLPTFINMKCPTCTYSIRRLRSSKKTYPCFKCATVF